MRLSIALVTIIAFTRLFWSEPAEAQPSEVSRVMIRGTVQVDESVLRDLTALPGRAGSKPRIRVTLFDQRFEFPDDLAATERNPNAVAATDTDEAGAYSLQVTDFPEGADFLLRFSVDGTQLGSMPLAIESSDDGKEIIRDFTITSAVGGDAGSPDPVALVEVFFATDRAPSPDVAAKYENTRASDANLHYGRIEVTIPQSHQRGQLERPAWWSLVAPEDPRKHFTIRTRTSYQEDAFLTELARKLGNRASADDALIFVHGYNVTFDEAIYRSAQLGYDLRFPGSVVAFSWPSKAHIYAYSHDRTVVDWSAPHLGKFLEAVAARSGASTIHVVAHSMGAEVLSKALSTASPDLKERLHQVVLAAPDIDAGVFVQLAAAMEERAQKITLYASSRDMALRVSKVFNGAVRAGDSEPLTMFAGIDSIDASQVRSPDLFGHSLYGDAVVVLDDMYYLINAGIPPGQRAGLRTRTKDGQTYWAFAP